MGGTPMGEGYYIVLISLHGLVRGREIELGRDADTGGQITYVVELAKELAKHPDVAQVDLFTRQVTDPKVDAAYARPEEPLGENARIIRLPFGPKRYLRKEVLWPYLDGCVDQGLKHFRKERRIPDIIHGHYADAGYVGAMLSGLLEVPFVFTGHSLGRVKRERLLEKGLSGQEVQHRYNIAQRIEAEEVALDSASLVITSTQQEVKEQYALYDNYEPQRMVVIPPGVDLSRFTTPKDDHIPEPICQRVAPFLRDPDKPMILALSRADERKNIAALVEAYGRDARLQALANLVIVAGNREDIRELSKGARAVLNQLLILIDRYDLYGKVAYPKHHRSEEVPLFYQGAAVSGGVFVNPALTEPFGLTLIEAAASGVPIIATNDGGPQDIVRNCQNGLLIDPLDISGISDALYRMLSDTGARETWAKEGIMGVDRYYRWSRHVQGYIQRAEAVIRHSKPHTFNVAFNRKMPLTSRVIVSDIDNTLIGCKEGLGELLAYLHESGGNFSFGIATGRRLESAVAVIKEWEVPMPQILITSVGSEIHYGPRLVRDEGWRRHINFRWEPEKIRAVLEGFDGLTLQAATEQREFKISYNVDPVKGPGKREVTRMLRQHHLRFHLIYSHGKYLDILPIRASKGAAVRHLALKWGLPMEQFLVAGDSGNDEEMLKGNTLGVVVGNYSRELEKLKGRPDVYFAQNHYAKGILEGINHFDFLDIPLRVKEEL